MTLAQQLREEYPRKKLEHPDWNIWTFICDECSGEFHWTEPRNKCPHCDPPPWWKNRISK